jgi:small subunit ribosomal protein S20
MPIIQSAIKRARQNEVRRARRQSTKTFLKTMMRKVADAHKAKDKKELETLLPQAYKAIDTAAKKQIIHPKNAARKKSLVSRMLASVA